MYCSPSQRSVKGISIGILFQSRKYQTTRVTGFERPNAASSTSRVCASPGWLKPTAISTNQPLRQASGAAPAHLGQGHCHQEQLEPKICHDPYPGADGSQGRRDLRSAIAGCLVATPCWPPCNTAFVFSKPWLHLGSSVDPQSISLHRSP